mgnify:CR=1 FL=1
MRLNFDCTPGREFRRPFLRRWALLLAFTMGGALVPAHARDGVEVGGNSAFAKLVPCLLYTSDAADERSRVDLGGRRIIKQKQHNEVRA